MKILAIIVAVIIYLVVVIFMWKDGYKHGKHDGEIDERIKCKKKIDSAFFEGKDAGEKETLRRISPPYLYELSKKMRTISTTRSIPTRGVLDDDYVSDTIVKAKTALFEMLTSYIKIEVEKGILTDTVSYTASIRIIADQVPDEERQQR